jgi:uncharacterized protein (TIGR00255 family)
MKSMTGFGRARVELVSGVAFDVEVKSVNHRFLEVACKYPKTITSGLEIQIRKLISQKLKRGKVDVSISTISLVNKSDSTDDLNVELLDKYAQVFIKAASRTKSIAPDYKFSDEAIKFLLLQSGVVNISESNLENDEQEFAVNQNILQAVTSAIDELLLMRTAEGAQLATTISDQLNLLQEQVQTVSRLNSGSSKVLCDKLKLRVQDLFSQTEVASNKADEIFQQRLAQEIVLISDKVDVTEEVTRLESHILQFKQKISDKSQNDNSIGRELDFLCQEIGRECNTIGSKSQMIEITKIVIELKVLLEQIREQVQNIE